MQETLIDLAARKVMSLLVAKFAFLAFPVINPIAALVVGTIIKMAITETDLRFYFVHVDIRTSAQAKAFEEATVAHEAAKKGGDSEAIRKSEAARIDAARDLIRFGRL